MEFNKKKGQGGGRRRGGVAGQRGLRKWGGSQNAPYEGHFQIPAGMLVRGGRRQSICKPALHIPQRSIFSS